MSPRTTRRRRPGARSIPRVARRRVGDPLLYPKDLTPVCTPELGDVSRLKGEFDERGAKVIGLSLDPIDSHERWVGEIADATGQALNFPLIADPDRKVSNL